MKPINEMTDQELAEAVAVEVLGWFDMETEHWIAPYHDDEPLGLAAYWKEKEPHGDSILTVFGGVLCADGREAIENELKRRGWTFSSRYVAIANLHFFEIWIPERGGLEPDYMSLQKSFYLAIAEAALMAVRGEASHGKD